MNLIKLEVSDASKISNLKRFMLFVLLSLRQCAASRMWVVVIVAYIVAFLGNKNGINLIKLKISDASTLPSPVPGEEGHFQ